MGCIFEELGALVLGESCGKLEMYVRCSAEVFGRGTDKLQEDRREELVMS